MVIIDSKLSHHQISCETVVVLVVAAVACDIEGDQMQYSTLISFRSTAAYDISNFGFGRNLIG
jgi:hypothetical protein